MKAGTRLAFLVGLVIFTLTPSLLAASCENLASLKLPNTLITSASTVAAGAFTLPVAGGMWIAGQPMFTEYAKLPAFCRVQATLTPSTDSDIKIEVWMPLSAWNGKLESIGNGGWAGIISYPGLAQALLDNYAGVSTDTGHTGNTGKFALGHPEKFKDFGYRAVHEMTVAAKSIIAAFYSAGPKLSYWNGCSTGGRQGLTEAQRYPSDYDGIIAGAPANNRMHMYAWVLSIAKAVHKDQASNIPPEKYPLIHKAVMEACDALDGVKDGLIGDPTRCHFDPKALTCKGVDGPSCLTPAQVQSARAFYAPAKIPGSGQEIYPGLEPGSELGWATILAGPESSPYTPLLYAMDGFRYVVFNDPNWDFRTFDLNRDVARADQVDNGTTSAMDPNLKEFFSRGGKLLMYHGWSDPNIPPMNTVHYYNNMLEATGGLAADSARLFMFPGMGHCGGGEGPNFFDAGSLLARWVETRAAPKQILASDFTNGVVDRARPVCPYPQFAAFKGNGSIDDPSNFVCKAR